MFYARFPFVFLYQVVSINIVMKRAVISCNVVVIAKFWSSVTIGRPFISHRGHDMKDLTIERKFHVGKYLTEAFIYGKKTIPVGQILFHEDRLNLILKDFITWPFIRFISHFFQFSHQFSIDLF